MSEAPPGSEEALRSAALAAGLEVTAGEVPRLLRQLGGRSDVSEAALRRALFDVRRRAWRERLAVLARRAEALPVSAADLDLAVTAVEELSAGDAELMAALREVVLVRLGGYGTPATALDAALGDLPKGPSGEVSLEAVEHCAGLVAEAFALLPADAAAFARRAVETERRRRGERRAAARMARETRAEEEGRLKAWEASLVPAEAVPALLGCTREEAERWIRAGLVPVARRVVVRRSGRAMREAEFDPAALERLRQAVPGWRRSLGERPAEGVTGCPGGRAGVKQCRGCARGRARPLRRAFRDGTRAGPTTDRLSWADQLGQDLLRAVAACGGRERGHPRPAAAAGA
jgi:ATP-dependent RNA helicase SUPV3L1/SUV3